MRVKVSDFTDDVLPVSESLGNAEEFDTRLDVFELWLRMAQLKIATGSLASTGEKARLRGYQRYAVARILEESPRSTADNFVPTHSMSTISVPRKRGKSWLAAVLILYFMTVEGQTCGVISGTKDMGTGTIMNSMRRALEGSPLQHHFKFKEGVVEYRPVPGGPVTAKCLFLVARASLLQGYALGFAVVDESHYIPQRHLVPSLAVLKSAGGDTVAGTIVLQISTSNKGSSDPEQLTHPLFQDVFAVQDGEPPVDSSFVAVWGHHDKAEFDVDDIEDYCLERLEDPRLVAAIEGYINRCHGGMFGDEATGEGSLGSLVSLRESWPVDERSVPDWLAYQMNYFSRRPSSNFEPYSFLPARVLARSTAYTEEDRLWSPTLRSRTFIGLDGAQNDDYTAAVAVKWLVDEDVFIVDWAKVWKPQEQPDHYVSKTEVYDTLMEYVEQVLADPYGSLDMIVFEAAFMAAFVDKMRKEPRVAGKYQRRGVSRSGNGAMRSVFRESLVHRKLLLPREADFTNEILSHIGNTVIAANGSMAKKGGQRGREKIDAAVALATATYQAEMTARRESPTGYGPVSRAVRMVTEADEQRKLQALTDRQQERPNMNADAFKGMFG